jgi:GTP-binding protein
MMSIGKAVFVKSSARVSDCPKDNKPELAFIGRSNVGKSSLINMLANRSKLAKTSSTPGKTQLINHFLVDESWHIVDLPGYGYARMPESERNKMMKLARDYIIGRENLICLLLLIDARLEMQKTDSEFLEFLGKNKIPFVIVFTKIDKVSPNRLEINIQQFKKKMLQQWESMPPDFQTSSLKKTGRDELLKFIKETLQ